jgi:hypothetical protein
LHRTRAQLARLHGAVGAHTLSATAHAEQCDAQRRETHEWDARRAAARREANRAARELEHMRYKLPRAQIEIES